MFYPDLWTPPAEADAFDGDEGVYLPIAWADVSWRAPQSAIDDIAAIIKEAKSLTIVYMIGLPGASFLFVAYHAFALYVKRRVARGQREARDERQRADSPTKRTRAARTSSSARDPRFQRGGPPPLGPLVVEKAKPFEDPYAVAERDHRDDASVVVVDVNADAKNKIVPRVQKRELPASPPLPATCSLLRKRVRDGNKKSSRVSSCLHRHLFSSF